MRSRELSSLMMKAKRWVRDGGFNAILRLSLICHTITKEVPTHARAMHTHTLHLASSKSPTAFAYIYQQVEYS